MTHNPDKPKRKHAPYLHRRLHLLLLAWTGVMFLVTIYNLWLIPPYFRITPHLYLATGLGYLYIILRYIRDYGWRWLTVVLMVGCLGMTSYSTKMIEHRTQASECRVIRQGNLTIHECRKPGYCSKFYAYTTFGDLPVGIMTYEVQGIFDDACSPSVWY
jgi:hypothetical protein